MACSSAVMNAEVDSSGEVSYDAVVKSGTNSTKKVFAKHSDLVGTSPSAEDVALPSASEERSTAERTLAALSCLVSSQSALAKPTGSAMFPKKSHSACTPVPAPSPDTSIPDSTTKWPDLCVASCFRFASLPFTLFFYAMQDSDFGPEDEFNASTKPLFDRNAAQSIYRPKIAPLSIPKKSTEI